MSKVDDGSMPAYPHNINHCDASERGLTKREHLAGQALMGLSAVWALGEVDDYQREDVAEDCVKLADALLAELAKEGDNDGE